MVVWWTPETVHLWGETLCLDYANTVGWSPADEPVDPERTDVLRTEDMLRRWGQRLHLLTDDPEVVSTIELRRARTLRDTVYRLFSAIARDRKPATNDLDALLSTYVEAVKHAFLRASEDV